MKILIADDNKQITSILSDYAKKDGFEVFIAHDGRQAWDMFQERTFDIILLDVMMPHMDGFELCQRIRSVSMVPIFMITARGEDFEKIMGLDIGADDYIVKPFSPREVMARIRSILRRVSEKQEMQIIKIDNLHIDIEKFKVYIDAEEVKLTKKEIELLWVLATHAEKVFTRENLLDSVWGYDYYGDSRTVDSHIKRLRAKLDVFAHPLWTIETVWGMGYRFKGEAHEV